MHPTPLKLSLIYLHTSHLVDFGVTFEPMVTTINEDAGEIEAFKVVKKGLTEKTVTISLFLLVSPASECIAVCTKSAIIELTRLASILVL